MKKKKAKLFYIVVSMALTMSFFLIGVYSAATRTASVTGSLSFTASYVWVDYKVSKSQSFDPLGGEVIPTDTNFWHYADINGVSGTMKNDGDRTVSHDFKNNPIEVDAMNNKFILRVEFTRQEGWNRNYIVDISGLPTIGGMIQYISVAKSENSESSISHISNPTNISVTTDKVYFYIDFEMKKVNNFTAPTNYDFSLHFDLRLP